jgi:hypothetical protein
MVVVSIARFSDLPLSDESRGDYERAALVSPRTFKCREIREMFWKQTMR